MKTNYSERNPSRCETCAHGINGGWHAAYRFVCIEDGTDIPASGTVADGGIGESRVVDWPQHVKMLDWIKEHEVSKEGVCDDFKEKEAGQ